MAADVVLRYRSEGAAAAGAEARGLGRALDAVGHKRFNADTTGAVASLKRYGDAADRVGTKLMRVGRASTRLVTLPVVGALALSVKAFADFDGAMTKSLAVMGKVAPSIRKQMEDVARRSAKQLGLAAKDTAAGFYYLASAGLNAKQSMAALPVVARLARAGFMDMESATSLLVDSTSALGLKSKDARQNMTNLTRVSDVFAKSADASNASIQQMAEAITNKAGAALRFVHKPIEEGAAALAYMADQGTKGATAGEYLAIGLRDIARAAAKHPKAFKDAGVSVLDYQGNLRSIADISDEFTRKTKGMGDAQKYALLDQLGLTRSVGDFIRAINGGGNAIRAYQAKITGATGYTAKVAGREMEAFSLKMAALKARVVDAGISLGTILAPGVLAAADAFAGMLESVERLPQGAQKAIGVAVAMAAAFGPLALVVGGISRGIGGMARGAAAIGRIGGFGGMTASGAAGTLGGIGSTHVWVDNLGPAGLVGPVGGSMPGGVGGAASRTGQVATVAGRVPLVGGIPAGGIMGPSGQRMIGGVPAASIMGGRFYQAGASVAYPAAASRTAMMAGGGTGGMGIVPRGVGVGARALGGRALVAVGAGAAVGSGVYGLSRGMGASRGVSSVLAGASGGATTGAMIGSLGGAPGMVAGALAGAAAGGLTAGFMQFAHSSTPEQVGQQAAAKFAKGLGAGAGKSVGAAQASLDAAKRNRANVTVQARTTGAAPGAEQRANARVEQAQRTLGLRAGAALSKGLMGGPQFKTAEQVSKAVIKRLAVLDPEARKIAAKAAISSANELSKKGRLEGSADKVVKAITRRFGDLESDLPRTAKKGAAQFAAGLKMDKAVASAGKSMKSIGTVFEGFPKQAKTTSKNVREQYGQAMDFLATKAKSTNPKVAMAARTMQSQVSGAYKKVQAASKDVTTAGVGTGVAMAAAGTVGALGANTLAAGWESSAARVEAASSRIVAAGNRASNAGRGGKPPGGAAGGARIPGAYRGYDDNVIRVAGDEVVLTPTQQSMVPGGRRGLDDVLRRTGGNLGGHGFAKGGQVTPLTPAQRKAWDALTPAERTALLAQADAENRRFTVKRSGLGRRTSLSATDGATNVMDARHRNDTTQDKRADKASRAASKAAGITNPDKIEEAAQLAVDKIRRDEIREDTATVRKAAKTVTTAIGTNKGKLKKLYHSLGKVPAANRTKRDRIIEDIRTTRDTINRLYDEHAALVKQGADLQAAAKDLDFDIGELAADIATLPDQGGDADTLTPDQQAQSDRDKADAAAAVNRERGANSFIGSLGGSAGEGGGITHVTFINEGVMHPMDVAGWLTESLNSQGHSTASVERSGA